MDYTNSLEQEKLFPYNFELKQFIASAMFSRSGPNDLALIWLQHEKFVLSQEQTIAFVNYLFL